MTTTQFHNALLQGRGTCYLAAKSDPERYREEILWACRELMSFDTQCEGSRAWLVYQLVTLYPDPTPFVQAACDALVTCPSDGSWHIFSLAELVELFFQDGHQIAWQALMKKYRRLYHELRHIGPPKDACRWPAREDFEHLAVVLGWNRDHCTEIARDMGRLSLETEWCKDWPFDWFYDGKARKYLRSMTKSAETDPQLAEFLRVHEPAWQDLFAPRPKKRTRLPANCQDEEQLNAAVRTYLTASTPEEKVKALDAFHWTPYPSDPSPIIADTQSSHEPLRIAAWNCLGDIRHPAVREYALAHLDTCEGFAAFCANYEKKDESLLLDRLRSVPLDFEENTTWHGDQMAVRHIKKPPKAALQYIFDTTYCAWCRWCVLEDIGRRRMLTQELLQECLYDANDDIRSYARRCINRRKPK